MEPHTITDVVAQKNALNALISLWKEFDLDGKRTSLDAQATEIGESKETSINARKNLAKQTQDFKKTSDAEKLTGLGALLKLYQDEVDRLTRRCKSAEATFLQMYRLLAEVADPVPGLMAGVSLCDELSKSLEEAKTAKRKLTEQEEVAKEFATIKNQEVTVRKLEDRLKEYDAHLEDLVEERTSGIAKKLREENSLEIEMLKERANELQAQLNQAHSEQSRASNASENSQSRLFDLQVQKRYDKQQASRQSEVDLLTADLERAQSIIATLERENDFLKGNKESKSDLSRQGIDLELSVAHKEIEVARLTDQVAALSATLEQERDNHGEEVERLDNELQIQRARYDQLAAEAATLPSAQSFEALKQELEVLKALVYGSEDGKTKAVGGNAPHGTLTNSAKAMTVEQALRDKTRQLESESMKLKMYLGERESEISTLRDRVGQLEEQVTEYQTLVEKLEDDLAKKHAPSSPKLGSPSTNPLGTATQANAGFPPAAGPDMLAIVCGQRDRFKGRLADMEAEHDRVVKQLEIARQELASFRQDNVKLYEKIRYLQSYNDSRGNRGGDIERGESKKLGEELEGKYGKMYEDTVVNPFAIFNRKERYRRYRELNHAERVILNTSQFFLSSKGPRLFLFFYSVLLHLLVFGTLYKMALTTAYP